MYVFSLYKKFKVDEKEENYWTRLQTDLPKLDGPPCKRTIHNIVQYKFTPRLLNLVN